MQGGKAAMTVSLEYATKLFKPETIRRLGRHYERVIRQVVEDPQKRIGEIELLDEGERRQLLEEFNDTAVDYPRDRCVQELFEEQARLRPEAVAVVYEEESLTYGQLNGRANQLARRLRKEGVKADSVVGLLVDRSLEMVVGILAILKAGGAYMPIDPNYPAERIEYMLRDSGSALVLTQTRQKGKVTGIGKAIDLEDAGHYRGKTADLARINTPQNLAYVIYTSGSTGRPKGVMIGHDGLVNRLIWMERQYRIGQEDIILQKTTYTFDVSVWELLLPLTIGARVCLLDLGGERDPEEIARVMERRKVTTVGF